VIWPTTGDEKREIALNSAWTQTSRSEVTPCLGGNNWNVHNGIADWRGLKRTDLLSDTLTLFNFGSKSQHLLLQFARRDSAVTSWLGLVNKQCGVGGWLTTTMVPKIYDMSITIRWSPLSQLLGKQSAVLTVLLFIHIYIYLFINNSIQFQHDRWQQCLRAFRGPSTFSPVIVAEDEWNPYFDICIVRPPPTFFITTTAVTRLWRCGLEFSRS
jgi:hypothetical protein